MEKFVLLDIGDNIAIITLNRPKRYNSLVPELVEALLETLVRVEKNEDVKVVILRANSPVFSTGGDLKGFKDHLSDIEHYSKKLVGLLNQAILAILEMKLPVICEVHGMVTGGSLGLVLASDIVLVTDSATFTPYYSVVGFCPDGGWTAMLPGIIGTKRTAQILMCNNTITAEQALAWGMANKMVQGDMIHDKALETAKKIIDKKQGSIHITKKILNSDIQKTGRGLTRELNGFVERVQTKEVQNGINEFLKR